MQSSVYAVNKGINKPIEFKGLKAQYIWYLGVGVLLLLIVFAILYVMGLNAFICLGLILIGGFMVFSNVYAMSKKYGEHGQMKKLARRRTPKVILFSSRKLFFIINR